MHAATASPSTAPRPPRALPRTSRTPPLTASTPAAAPAGSEAPSASTLTARTITGAVPRATGYTTLSGASWYAVASSARYASSRATDATAYGATPARTSHVNAATGANTAAPIPSATPAATCDSPARAVSRFHAACTTAAARASASASSGNRRLLEQARQPPVLEHAPARLLLRAVAHHVVLVVHRLEGRSAPRAGIALVAVDEERHRQLVGDRQLHDPLVVVERPVEAADDRRAQRLGLVVVEVVAALERRQVGGPENLVDPRAPDAGDDALVAQHRVQRSRALWREQLAQRRRVGPRVGAERRERLVLLQRVRAEHLHPRRLLRAELAQAQLAPVVDPQQEPGRAVAQRGALVEELQPPGRHEVEEHREIARDVHDEVLAAPPDARDRRALERVQRRVERLQRVDARRERGLDRRAAQGGVEAARRDLDLGQLGHTSESTSAAAARSRRRAAARRRHAGRTARRRRRAAGGTPRGAARRCGRRGRSSSRRTSRPRRRCAP